MFCSNCNSIRRLLRSLTSTRDYLIVSDIYDKRRLGSLSEWQKFRIAKKVGIGIFSVPISLCQTKLWLD